MLTISYLLASKVMLIVMQRRRKSYNTSSLNTRIVKTPGGKLRYLHIKKKGTAVKCGKLKYSVSKRVANLSSQVVTVEPNSQAYVPKTSMSNDLVPLRRHKRSSTA